MLNDDGAGEKEAIDIYADTLELNAESLRELAARLRARDGNCGEVGKTLGRMAENLLRIGTVFLVAENEFRKTGLH